MSRRLDLQALLKTFVKNVYFQPPESYKLEFPCIVYHMTSPNVKSADDSVYLYRNRYQVTLVHSNPDNDIWEKMLTTIPLCSLSSTYCKNNMYHYAFEIYY